MGEVYRAKDTKLGRDAVCRERKATETIPALNHPGIAVTSKKMSKTIATMGLILLFASFGNSYAQERSPTHDWSRLKEIAIGNKLRVQLDGGMIEGRLVRVSASKLYLGDSVEVTKERILAVYEMVPRSRLKAIVIGSAVTVGIMLLPCRVAPQAGGSSTSADAAVAACTASAAVFGGLFGWAFHAIRGDGEELMYVKAESESARQGSTVSSWQGAVTQELTSRIIERLSDPSVLFRRVLALNWDVAANRERFVMPKPGDVTPYDDIHVVLDRFDELERLVPTGN